MMNGGMGGMGWMWIFWLLLIVGTIVVVVVLVKAFKGHTSGSAPSRDRASAPSPGTGSLRARQILEERFARGEISTEEYRERRRALEEGDQ